MVMHGMQPADPAEVQYPDCAIKSLMCMNSNVFVAMVSDRREPGASQILCPNTQQNIPVPGKVDDCVVRCLPCLLPRLVYLACYLACSCTVYP